MVDRPQAVLDTTGLLCPIPVIKTSRKLDELDPGALLQVEADDPAFPEDLRTWLESQPHELLDLKNKDGSFLATLKKRGSVEQ